MMSESRNSRQSAALLDALLDPAVLIDGEGQPLHVNAAWLDKIGWTRSELIEAGFAPALDDDTLARLVVEYRSERMPTPERG